MSILESHIRAKDYRPIPAETPQEDTSLELLGKLVQRMAEGVKKCRLSVLPGRDFRSVFEDFDEESNGVSTSVYRRSLTSLTESSSFLINGWIEMHILHSPSDGNLVALLCLATGSFDLSFISPARRSGRLSIYASLDDCRRVLQGPRVIDRTWTLQLGKESAGFTVSGVTYLDQHRIVLTKKQEIIKLLFHELVHYSGLDKRMRSGDPSYPALGAVDLPEAYSEAASVVLHSVFAAVIVPSENPSREVSVIFRIEQEYSKHLSAMILLYYGYTQATLSQFPRSEFDHSCPIAIWEYVIFRTNLLREPRLIIESLVYPERKSGEIMSDLALSQDLFTLLPTQARLSFPLDVSYIYHDIDWESVRTASH